MLDMIAHTFQKCVMNPKIRSDELPFFINGNREVDLPSQYLKRNRKMENEGRETVKML
jgi:hypothetical protein